MTPEQLAVIAQAKIGALGEQVLWTPHGEPVCTRFAIFRTDSQGLDLGLDITIRPEIHVLPTDFPGVAPGDGIVVRDQGYTVALPPLAASGLMTIQLRLAHG